jgi:type IV pilus assembly protein PilO
MANLPRIVTLNNMVLTTKEGALQLEAVAKTFRYLDADEIGAQKKARKNKKAQEGAAK